MFLFNFLLIPYFSWRLEAARVWGIHLHINPKTSDPSCPPPNFPSTRRNQAGSFTCCVLFNYLNERAVCPSALNMSRATSPGRASQSASWRGVPLLCNAGACRQGDPLGRRSWLRALILWASSSASFRHSNLRQCVSRPHRKRLGTVSCALSIINKTLNITRHCKSSRRRHDDLSGETPLNGHSRRWNKSYDWLGFLFFLNLWLCDCGYFVLWLVLVALTVEGNRLRDIYHRGWWVNEWVFLEPCNYVSDIVTAPHTNTAALELLTYLVTYKLVL